MASMASRSIVQKIGTAVKEVAKNKSSSWWYTPHMAAASRAIAERMPLVDLVLEVRDARVPLSSACNQFGALLSSSRRIIVLNKMDLAKRSNVKLFRIGPHILTNRTLFRLELMPTIRIIFMRVRELVKTTHSSQTFTIMLVGMPNVGKSALANSLHQVGRISAAEKGKLKHTAVSPDPGETKNISSLKIASHPNIYVLDTPGVLSPMILDEDVCSNLALTGAISDYIVGKIELAKYFLSILNLSDEYKKWEKFYATGSIFTESEASQNSHLEKRRMRERDHTQDFIVNDVRRIFFEAISSFSGNLENAEDLLLLIEAELTMLQSAFRITPESQENDHGKVANKLLDLYRTGRLGHYILDPIPRCS